MANIAAAKEYDVHASIVTSCLFNSTSKEWTISSAPIYTLPELNPPVYHELFAIPNITAQSSASISNISTLTAEPQIPQLYQTFVTSTYAASPKLLIDLFNAANATVRSMQFPADVRWSIAFEPLPTVFTQQGEGRNVLGTSTADGNGVVLLLAHHGLIQAQPSSDRPWDRTSLKLWTTRLQKQEACVASSI